MYHLQEAEVMPVVISANDWVTRGWLAAKQKLHRESWHSKSMQKAGLLGTVNILKKVVGFTMDTTHWLSSFFQNFQILIDVVDFSALYLLSVFV